MTYSSLIHTDTLTTVPFDQTSNPRDERATLVAAASTLVPSKRRNKPICEDLCRRARTVKAAIVDPEALGLDGLRREGGGWKARCVWHSEKTPSLQLRLYADGLGAKCFGCERGGTILDVLAAQLGLEPRGRDFARVVEWGERLAGVLSKSSPPNRLSVRYVPERTTPPREEVERLWNDSAQTTDDREGTSWLKGRCIEPDTVEERDLARSLRRNSRLPRWAGSATGTWIESGHCLLVPTHDAAGEFVSLQSRAVVDTTPKALWPAGYRASGIFADQLGRRMLAGAKLEGWDGRLVIAEGIPDYLTWATHFSDSVDVPAILGMAAGTWSSEIANRVPDGARVILRTHHDEAGDRYAAEIARSLAGRCEVLR